MKQIKIDQIQVVLQAIYQTNISAQNFDAIKKLFADLPVVNETTNAKEIKGTEPEGDKQAE